MKKIEAKIVSDSINQQGNRITSFILTYPRFIHSELMTHRMFSRNSASSRAIPFEKMVKMIEEDPFIPIAWQKDHKGMQGTEYIKELQKGFSYESAWIRARNSTVEYAKHLHNHGLTKQLCNRLLEPFMWHTVLVTATEYDNFFELRCPKYSFGLNTSKPKIWKSRKDAIREFPDWKDRNDLFWYSINQSQAEIHIQALAETMWDAMNESTPKKLEAGEWHIPFGNQIDHKLLLETCNRLKIPILRWQDGEQVKVWIATARCARLSYMTFEGEIDYEKDIKLHNQLLQNYHMSPFEHCAKVMTSYEFETYVKGIIRLDENNELLETSPNCFGWCNNFRGFISYRYLIETHETRRKNR